MITLTRDKKMIYSCLVGLVVFLAVWFFYQKKQTDKLITQPDSGQPILIDDNPILPDTQSIGLRDTQLVASGTYQVKLQPQTITEEVIINDAKLTTKLAYDLAMKEASSWTSDAKLVLVKSLGAVDLAGRSSQWQLVFGSNLKRTSYEVIIQGDQVANKKIVSSLNDGYELPNNWYDSDQAIDSLQSSPQFADETISSIAFLYNSKEKAWYYGFAMSSDKTTSMWVR